MTIFLQGDDADYFLEHYCELCYKPSKEWANPDKNGSFEAVVYRDEDGDMCGIICPICASK